MTQASPVFQSVEQLAQYLGISRAQAYKMLRLGVIPSIRLGKRFVLPRVAIDKWMESAVSGPVA
jgi:excisionase family DNA binding protein